MISFFIYIFGITFSILLTFAGIDYLVVDSKIFFEGIVDYPIVHSIRPLEIFFWIILCGIGIISFIMLQKHEKTIFLQDIQHWYTRFVLRIILQKLSFIILYLLLRKHLSHDFTELSDFFVAFFISIFLFYKFVTLKEHNKAHTNKSTYKHPVQ